MTWIALARENTSPKIAAQLMGCDAKTARRRLEEAVDEVACSHRRFHTREQNIRKAVEVILADGVVRQEISRHAWEDVALGLKRAA